MNEQNFEAWWAIQNTRLTDIPVAQARFIFNSIIEYARSEQVPVAWLCKWEDWQQYHDETDPLPTKWDDEPPDAIIELYSHQPAKPAEYEAVRGLVQMLQIAKQSMLDSGYNPRSSIIHACNLALETYEEATK